MNELILATNNHGKIKELCELLTPIHCIPQAKLGIEDIEETGLTFVENALLKARHACASAQKPALADDSGLVVPSLNGEPGIYSARYSEPGATVAKNNDLLLKNMKHLPQDQRQAYFYCAIVLMRHAEDPTPLIATGLFHGVIHTEEVGTGGLGYDPIFFLPEYQCTVAQLPDTIKNNISHRAQAINQLRSFIISN
jgi:XTP/dITP diphosphohydrolase